MTFKTKLLEIIRCLSLTTLNDEQLKHAATTLRLFGFAVLGAIGWPAFNAGNWFEVCYTAIAFLLCEYVALLFLEDVESK